MPVGDQRRSRGRAVIGGREPFHEARAGWGRLEGWRVGGAPSKHMRQELEIQTEKLRAGATHRLSFLYTPTVCTSALEGGSSYTPS